jgi:hypothetical protein
MPSKREGIWVMTKYFLFCLTLSAGIIIGAQLLSQTSFARWLHNMLFGGS